MKRLVPLMFAAALALLLGACKDNPVGRVCFTGQDAGFLENIVAAPELDCESRTCLHIADHSPDLCTAQCSSDSDCQNEGSSCKGGFACRVAVVTGPFCCEKMCVCRDYLDEVDGGTGAPPPPAACDPTNAANECCNLKGRRQDATKYPQCQ